MSNLYNHSTNMLATLKELYGGLDFEANKMHGPQTELESILNPTDYEKHSDFNMFDLVYKHNPFLKLIKE